MTIAKYRVGLIAVAAAIPLAACTDMDGRGRGPGYAYDRDGYVLGPNDNIYRENDGRYYCNKPDGTRGAVIRHG